MLTRAGQADLARQELLGGLDRIRRESHHPGASATPLLWRVLLQLAGAQDSQGDRTGALSTAASALHQAKKLGRNRVDGALVQPPDAAPSKRTNR